MALAPARALACAGAAALLAGALAGCSDSAPPPPPGVTKNEAEALQDAAEMIDERRLPLEEGAREAAPEASATAQ